MSEDPGHFVRRLELLWGRGFMLPGGLLAASGWLSGEDRETSAEWQACQALVPYRLKPANGRECATMRRTQTAAVVAGAMRPTHLRETAP